MRDRDEDAFRVWAEAKSAPLRRYAFLLKPDWHEAADVAQKALVAVYLNWHRLERGNPTAYAHTAIRNAIHDNHKSAWSQRVDYPGTFPDVATWDAYDLGDRRDLLHALQALPIGMRSAVVLRYWEGYSLEEAAHVMGCSQGNVKSQASRGLQKLRELLGQVGAE